MLAPARVSVEVKAWRTPCFLEYGGAKMRRQVLAVTFTLVVAAGTAAACGGRQPGTTTPTSGTYDVEAGPCSCRLPQDEYLTCCRAGLELTCRCGDRYACNTVPSGRTCSERGR